MPRINYFNGLKSLLTAYMEGWACANFDIINRKYTETRNPYQPLENPNRIAWYDGYQDLLLTVRSLIDNK